VFRRVEPFIIRKVFEESRTIYILKFTLTFFLVSMKRESAAHESPSKRSKLDNEPFKIVNSSFVTIRESSSSSISKWPFISPPSNTPSLTCVQEHFSRLISSCLSTNHVNVLLLPSTCLIVEGNASIRTYDSSLTRIIDSSMSYGHPITSIASTSIFPVLCDKERDLIIGDEAGNVLITHNGR
jgi:hypothetical protein